MGRFGAWKHRKYIAIHEIASQLGVAKSTTLLFFTFFQSVCHRLATSEKDCMGYMDCIF